MCILHQKDKCCWLILMDFTRMRSKVMSKWVRAKLKVKDLLVTMIVVFILAPYSSKLAEIHRTVIKNMAEHHLVVTVVLLACIQYGFANAISHAVWSSSTLSISPVHSTKPASDMISSPIISSSLTTSIVPVSSVFNQTKLSHHNYSHPGDGKGIPDTLECQTFLVSVKLTKRPPDSSESASFNDMTCHICDNVKMIYRCYPCFTSVEFHNVTTLANNESVANLLMKFSCDGKHLRVLEAILKPRSIINAECYKPAACPTPWPALEEHQPALCPQHNRCTSPICIGSAHYQVTPYPEVCPTTYPVDPAPLIQTAVVPPLVHVEPSLVPSLPHQTHQHVYTPVSYPIHYPQNPYFSPNRDSHSSDSEEQSGNKEDQNNEEVEKPQPIQIQGQTYVFPEEVTKPDTHGHRLDNKVQENLPHAPYLHGYSFPVHYPLSYSGPTDPCLPQCQNVCAPSCHPACCRSGTSDRYKTFIQKMRNAATNIKYRNPFFKE